MAAIVQLLQTLIEYGKYIYILLYNLQHILLHSV